MDADKGVPRRMAFVCRCTKHLNPPGLASLFVRIGCLPEERHIAGLRYGIGIVDKDRVCAGRHDLHVTERVEVHDVPSPHVVRSLGYASGVIHAGPYEAGAWTM